MASKTRGRDAESTAGVSRAPFKVRPLKVIPKTEILIISIRSVCLLIGAHKKLACGSQPRAQSPTRPTQRRRQSVRTLKLTPNTVQSNIVVAKPFRGAGKAFSLLLKLP
jgi:hypothetical protein